MKEQNNKIIPEDDNATIDDMEAIEEARKEFENNETISHVDIDWN